MAQIPGPNTSRSNSLPRPTSPSPSVVSEKAEAELQVSWFMNVITEIRKKEMFQRTLYICVNKIPLKCKVIRSSNMASDTKLQTNSVNQNANSVVCFDDCQNISLLSWVCFCSLVFGLPEALISYRGRELATSSGLVFLRKFQSNKTHTDTPNTQILHIGSYELVDVSNYWSLDYSLTNYSSLYPTYE